MLPIKPAKHIVFLWMKITGFRGITLPWAIYLHPTRINDERLIRHETKHVEQMKQDGVIIFYVKYLWWSIRYGYWNNPYETEARAAEISE